MNQLTTKIAILAAIGIAAVGPVPTFAASTYGGHPASGTDCSLPINSDDETCKAMIGFGGLGGKNNRSSGGAFMSTARTDLAPSSGNAPGSNGSQNSNSATGVTGPAPGDCRFLRLFPTNDSGSGCPPTAPDSGFTQ